MIHYMDKSWMPDLYTNRDCNDIVLNTYTLIWSWSLFFDYDSFRSSWKAFQKIMEHFWQGVCPFIL